jgi:predicted enzyme related to lactoylglutathione lyase
MSTRSKSHFIWHELMTDDVPGALAFYGHVLGLTAEKLPSAEGGEYHVLSAGGRGMGGAMPLRDGMTKAFWVGYLATDDVDAGAARLEKAGGKVMRAAADIPNVGRFALVTDPQGAGFVLFEPTRCSRRSRLPRCTWCARPTRRGSPSARCNKRPWS